MEQPLEKPRRLSSGERAEGRTGSRLCPWRRAGNQQWPSPGSTSRYPSVLSLILLQ